MLGSDLVALLSKHYSVYGLTRKQDDRPTFAVCDITDRADTIKAIERINPKVVIHAAAWADVDACEINRAKAMKVNFEGTKNVVDGCRHVKGLLIYISTDFVFSGNQKDAYKETNMTHPVNVYGESKLLGEFYTRSQSLDYWIVRTSWLFGKNGNNFMSKILEKAKSGERLNVVHDQKGCPTYTKDLAKAILRMIDRRFESEKQPMLNGIYHVCNREPATRYEVALEIVGRKGLKDVKVDPVGSDEVKTLAARPKNSTLDMSKFEKSFDFAMRSWKDALVDYIKELN